ncbi:hypothetical protein D1818_10115 [Aquimarina sp. BL5]|uniref:hypothetical protein n=1 Tax=Aquimarina sp. BL5 TaxID=1714860 RepID=UPI000E54B8CC|nr:hypothetical protein [Aquimarina sp. BL5]AXT51163.1 hypothetical protein D1818_10115 [Aquimarina sp. BL5]RKN09228.1 hypothetical protein D7036_04575 [Aquimarina sp. BL5]
MRHLLFNIILILFVTSCNSQTNFDKARIDSINQFISENLKNDLGKHIVFNINDKYLVIDNNDQNKVYYLSDKKGYESYEIDKSEILNQFFESKSNIKRNIKAYSGSDYKDSCSSTFIYFAMNDKIDTLFDFHLPSMLLCDDKKVSYPIDNKILNYLNGLILKKWPNG